MSEETLQTRPEVARLHALLSTRYQRFWASEMVRRPTESSVRTVARECRAKGSLRAFRRRVGDARSAVGHRGASPRSAAVARGEDWSSAPLGRRSTPGRSRQGMSFTGSSQEPASLLLPGDGLGPTGRLRELRAAPGTRRRARPINGRARRVLGLRRPSPAGRRCAGERGGSGQLPRIRSAAFSASIIVGAWVALLGQSGITEASATARPSIPCTPIVSGSTTDSPSVPSRHVDVGCMFDCAVRATQSRISSSVSTPGPGQVSPPSSSLKAGWLSRSRAMCTASTQNRRSTSLPR